MASARASRCPPSARLRSSGALPVRRFARCGSIAVALSSFAGVALAGARTPPDVLLDAPYIALGAPPGAHFVLAADFDADGRTDLLVATHDEYQVSLRRGRFRFDTLPAQALTDILVLQSADVDGDGRPDLVATRATNRLTILHGNGDGTFSTRTDVATDITPDVVVATRVDADANLDVVTGNFGSRTLSFFRGRGDGAFEPREDLAVPGYPSDIQVADLDRDGINDLVVTLRGTGTLFVLRRDGSSGLGGTSASYPTLRDPRGAFVADSNADGTPDVLVFAQRSPTFDRFLGGGGGLSRVSASLPPLGL